MRNTVRRSDTKKHILRKGARFHPLLSLKQMMCLVPVLCPKGISTNRFSGLPSSMKDARKLGDVYHQRWKSLARNWPSVRLAFKLAYGVIKPGKEYYPHNRALLSKMFKFISQVYHVGILRAVKEWSSLTRIRALCTGQDISGRINYHANARGKERLALFIASTLARGTSADSCDASEVAKEVKEAIDRLAAPRAPMPSISVLRRLKTFINARLAVCKDWTNAPLILPNNKSCVQLSSGKGGGAHILKPYFDESRVKLTDRLWAEERHRAIYQEAVSRHRGWAGYDDEVRRRADDAIDKAFGASNPENYWSRESVLKRYDYTPGETDLFAAKHIEMLDKDVFLKMELGITASLTTPELRAKWLTRKGLTLPARNDYETFLTVLEAAENNKVKIYDTKYLPCKPLGLETFNGKIRVACLHSAEQIWVARAFNQLIMPFTRQLPFSRAMLTNKTVHLKHRQRGNILLSADLSKSTDPMAVWLVRFVLCQFQKFIGDCPDWFYRAVNVVSTKHSLLFEDEETTLHCGAMMGIGPGWTVLSLVNAFCMSDTGVPDSAYAVCGDDLIGLVSHAQASAYNRNLELFGLLANHTKSHRSSKFGVFCERLVHASERGTRARARPCVRIGEACGVQAQSRNQLRLSVESLQSVTGLRSVVSEARASAKRGRLSALPGLYSQGGGGVGMPTGINVVVVALGGATKLQLIDTEHEVQKARTTLAALPTSVDGVTIEDVLTSVKAHVMKTKRSYLGLVQKKVKMIKHATAAAMIRKRYRSAEKLIKSSSTFQVLNTLREDPKSRIFKMPGKEYRKLTSAVRYGRHALAIRIIARYTNRKISAESATEILRSLQGYSPPLNLKGGAPRCESWDSNEHAAN